MPVRRELEDLVPYCPKCGYNLTGLTNNVCPECETPFDPATLPQLQAKRPPFIQGVLLVLLAPALYIFVLPVMTLLKDANETTLTALGMIFMTVTTILAVITSIIAGRRLARRLARKHPTDPPTPATVGMTILFASIFLFCQATLASFFLLMGCFGAMAMS